MLHKESTTISSILSFPKKKAWRCVMNIFCENIKSSIEGKFHKQEIEYPKLDFHIRKIWYQRRL